MTGDESNTAAAAPARSIFFFAIIDSSLRSSSQMTSSEGRLIPLIQFCYGFVAAVADLVGEQADQVLVVNVFLAVG